MSKNLISPPDIGSAVCAKMISNKMCWISNKSFTLYQCSKMKVCIRGGMDTTKIHSPMAVRKMTIRQTL